MPSIHSTSQLDAPPAANPSSADLRAIRQALLQLDAPVWFWREDDTLSFALQNQPTHSSNGKSSPAYLPPLPLESLGSAGFRSQYGTRYAYYAGSMANGISSEEMLITLGKAGFLGAFGSAGLVPARVEAAIQKVQSELPNQPYAFNLIFSPNEPALEQRAAELYLQHGVRTVEASAYVDITYALVYYRASGLSQNADGSAVIGNRSSLNSRAKKSPGASWNLPHSICSKPCSKKVKSPRCRRNWLSVCRWRMM